MGIYLGQQPPAELARLKAELAETLIANFCYPRFLDYRTNTLRMRPIDRSKRQEVWSFLSGYDFGPWNRIDVLSPEFQRQVERLLIQYVQRNRAFFGEQGRKRMSDVRALISASSLTVTDGLRGHLTGRRHSTLPFGSPRPVISWASATITPDLTWEQVGNATLVLQQQLQEGKVPAAFGENGSRAFSPTGANAPAGTPPRRSPRNRPFVTGNGSGAQTTPAAARPTPVERPVSPQEQPAPQPISPSQPPQTPQSTPAPIQAAKITNPLAAPASKNTVHPPSETPFMPASPFVTPPVPAERHVDPASHVEDVETQPISGEPPHALVEQLHVSEKAAQLPQPSPTSARELSRMPAPSLVDVPAKQQDSATVIVNDEDVVIFEQLKYQLTVWLRVEAVRLGMDITDKSPVQLIDDLRGQDNYDETRLQIVSTLLQLADTVGEKRQATLIEYKQAMMFYLMHTRTSR